MVLNSSKIIEQSGIKFGTSGARGLVEEFTSNVCASFVNAFISCIKLKFSFNKVAIAIDNRPSSYRMAQACVQALKQLNIEAIYYGVVPTPALAYVAMQDNIPCIMVTGSHIPFDRNGLKFYRPDGEITKEDEQAILNEVVEFEAIINLPELVINDEAAIQYVERYTSLFDSQMLAGKRIGIYEHSSAGRDLYVPLFKAFGAEVIALERSDYFVPIDTEAVAEVDIERAKKWSQQYSFDLIFSTDGDGDRPLVADEQGNWLRGDVLGLLCAHAMNIEALAVPVSCNTTIESCNLFKHVKRTKIGSPYVIAEFNDLGNKYKSIAGFEANGGFLLGSNIEVNGCLVKALPTRDAVLPALMLLAAAKQQTISSLVNSLPQRFTFSDRLQNFATEKSIILLMTAKQQPDMFLQQLGLNNSKAECIDETDGLRITLVSGDIIHFRPSGNAPELRCYAESSSYDKANRIVTVVLKKLQLIGIEME